MAVLGGVPSSLHCFETHLLRSCVETDVKPDGLRQDLHKLWNLEEISSPTDCVVNQFQKDITHNGTRYVTKLPFKPDHESVSDNYIVCKERLQSLRRSLVNKGILEKYRFPSSNPFEIVQVSTDTESTEVHENSADKDEGDREIG